MTDDLDLYFAPPPPPVQPLPMRRLRNVGQSPVVLNGGYVMPGATVEVPETALEQVAFLLRAGTVQLIDEEPHT